MTVYNMSAPGTERERAGHREGRASGVSWKRRRGLCSQPSSEVSLRKQHGLREPCISVQQEEREENQA
jgi:hypothetical protein